jgi:cell division septation protein DedD
VLLCFAIKLSSISYVWNLFRRPILKPTAPNIDKEAVRWSLSWLPEGRCDSFTKGAILLFAPPTSGVYGLFNFDCQVFIGESANIQEALLRHESETDFPSQHLRPTGFTFEPCAVELRKPKADELIARFHPVLQTETALNKTWSESSDPRVSEAGLGSQEETFSDHQEFPLHEREKQPKGRRYFYFKRTHVAALAAMFVASVVVIFYLGMPLDYAIQKRANGANPTSGQTEISLRPQNVSSMDTDDGIANQSVEPTPAKPDVHGSASTPNTAVQSATKSTPATDREGLQANASPMTDSSRSAHLGKKWSVQVSATPAKDIADTLVQRLKADGYDVYVVQAEVKGQTYYRVRVGYFDSHEKAQLVRQSLTRQEGYRDAYLTGD